MRLAGRIVLLALISVSSAANAAEYLHVNGHDQHWASDLMAFLLKNKPSPENVTIGMTPDFDIHAYVVPGTFTGVYTLQRLRHAPERANALVKAIMDGGTGKIIGFEHPLQQGQAPEPPTAPMQGDAKPPDGPGDQDRMNVYLLTWTKPAT
jgi:hypothetical protein